MFFIASSLIILGMVIIFLAIIGLFRFPNFYTKLHAASIIESCGVPICLFGLIFLQTSWLAIAKLLFMILLMFILAPVSSHVLGKASKNYHNATIPRAKKDW